MATNSCKLVTAAKRTYLSPTFALDLSLRVRHILRRPRDAPTPCRRGARQGPGRSSRSITTVVPKSLKRGAPKAPSRLSRWAVRRFVCGRATRMASLASRSGTNLPSEGWLCTVGVYCEVCGRHGSRWRCLALPAWRYLARSCRRQSSPGLAASPPHRHPKGGSYRNQSNGS